MDRWWLISLAVIAFVEGSAIVVATSLWLRSRRRVALLERERESAPDRGWVPQGREAMKAVWETAALVREKGVGGALRSSIEELLGWAQVERPDLTRLAGRDGAVTILFSDIEGSTALNEHLGDQDWVTLLKRHDGIVRRCVQKQNGHVIKTQGDGFMVAFGPAEAAIRCAVAVQRALAKDRRRPRHPTIKVRIGIHRGDAVHRDGDLFGRNVAFAARVASHAQGGEILVSDAVRDATLDTGPELVGLVFTDDRQIELKGLGGTHRVHTVRWAFPADVEQNDQQALREGE